MLFTNKKVQEINQTIENPILLYICELDNRSQLVRLSMAVKANIMSVIAYVKNKSRLVVFGSRGQWTKSKELEA